MNLITLDSQPDPDIFRKLCGLFHAVYNAKHRFASTRPARPIILKIYRRRRTLIKQAAEGRLVSVYIILPKITTRKRFKLISLLIANMQCVTDETIAQHATS